MASAILLERLRRALAPHHSVEMELASGGMGSVFLGHDRALDRPVAIKLLRPELASAAAAERFVAEARILAGLHHPNVVQVYRVGESEGLFFYVMEYLDGETLEARLGRGPLPLHLAYKVGRDLLDGLEAAHQHGVIHRDVKPANVMLLGRRALLTDFGIAVPADGAPNGEVAGPGWGTPGFMAPEQIVGAPVTLRSDIYAAGAVLYGVFSGRPWQGHEGKWDGIPRAVARILQRALATAPEERWPDAATFRRALWQNRSRRYVHRTIGLVATALVLGAFGARVGRWSDATLGSRLDPLQIVVHSFRVDGGVVPSTLGDSLAGLLRIDLAGQPDFSVLREDRGEDGGPVLALSGLVTVDGTTLRVRLSGTLADGTPVPLGEEFTVRGGSHTSIVDSAYPRILWSIWTIQSPIAASLPRRALPRTTAGLAEFFAAERMVGQGRWGEAHDAYRRALEYDPTCGLCAWRITDVQRWLGIDRDPALLAVARAQVDSFPPAYRSLVRAAGLPLQERIDTMERAALAAQGFFLPGLQLGDELFHRGPLIGRSRKDAVTVLETAAWLRPDYAPSWEHLLWARIAEGDQRGAEEAMAKLDSLGEVRDQVSRDLRALLRLGFAWRFYAPTDALAATHEALRDPAMTGDPRVGAGPRLLATFDVPLGAVMMGELLTGMPRADLVRSGTLAKLLGEVTLGRLDAAAATGLRYQGRGLEPSAELFVAELAAMLWRFDRAAHPDSAGLASLARLAAPGASGPLERRRAASMLVLLGGAMDTSLALPGTPFGELLRADGLARYGDIAGALARTDALALDPSIGIEDPFLRTAIHLLRAEWYTEFRNFAAARRELRWHENTDLVGYPTGAPQAGEVDWAFGTLGRWLRAQMMEREGRRGDELCAAYRGVERHWGGGDPIFIMRADSARARADQLQCPPAR